MPAVNINELAFERVTLLETDFANGPEHNTSITSGNVGVIGVAEVSEDGQLSSYDAYRAGQPPVSAEKPQGHEIYVDLETGTDGTDVDQKTEWRLAARTKNQNRVNPLHRWYTVRTTNTTTTSEQPPLAPTGPFVKAGRELVFQAKNESANVTVHRSNSDIEIPSVAGY